MKQITVRVVWTDSNNRARTVTMVTQKRHNKNMEGMYERG